MKRYWTLAFALIVALLTFPSPSTAGLREAVEFGAPDHWELEWPEKGKRFSIDAIPGGWVIEDIATGQREYAYDDSDIEIAVLAQDGERFVAQITTTDAPGGRSVLFLSGSLAPVGEVSSVSIFQRDGVSLAEGPIVGIPPESSHQIIDPGGRLIALVACVVLAIGAECGPECIETCGDSELVMFREGSCGSCSCWCH